MSEQTQVESSTTETADVFKGENPSLAEYAKYREDGTLPERFKTAEDAEPATADAQEETEESEGEAPEPEPDSDPDELQSLKPKTAKRIAQLLEKTRELERKLAEKQDAKQSEPSPAQQTAKEPTQDDLNPDGTPKWKTYEDFTKALARHEARQERAEWEREQTVKAAQAVLKGKLDEARERYEDADDVIFPANKAIQEANIPIAVKEVFGQSELFIDLCYVVGSDPKALADFIALAQSNPRAAIGKVFDYEREIAAEKAGSSRDGDGKFVASAPKKTSAPKPPAPVGGSSSRAFDVSDDSLSPEEWARKRTAQLASKT